MGCAGYPSASPEPPPQTPPFFGVALEGYPLSRERLAKRKRPWAFSRYGGLLSAVA
jgi:hypothetical protein